MSNHPAAAHLLLCVLLAGSSFASRAAERPSGVDDQPPTAAEKAARRALVDAAREAWETAQQRLEAGEAVTPSVVELVCQASRRWCLAEIDVAPDEATHDKARARHLNRIKSFHAMLTKRLEVGLDVSRVQVAQATYFLREAELWVAQATKEKK